MTEDRDTLEEAFAFSEYLHEYGEGFTTGIWEGDDELYDHVAWLDEITRRYMKRNGDE